MNILSRRVCSSFVALSVAAAATAVSALPADATTITIAANSGARGTLSDFDGNGTVDQSFGSSILVRTFPTIGQDTRGFAEFDIRGARATIVDSSLITAATLHLTAFSGGTVGPLTPNGVSVTPGFELDLYGYVGNGVIANSDYDQGTFLARQTLDGVNPLVSFSVIDFIVPQVATSASFVGVNLRTAFSELIGATPFAQFRTGPTGSQPFLSIEFDTPVVVDTDPDDVPDQGNPQQTTAIPEPGTLALIGAGLLALTRLRRRRTEAVR